MAKIKQSKTVTKATKTSKKTSKKTAAKKIKKAVNNLLPISEETKELAKPNKHFNKRDLLLFRDRLVKIREQIARKIGLLTADNLTRSEQDNHQDFRSEEQGTDNFERDFALNQVSFDQGTIFEIDEALERIRLGLYGICDSCGCGIEKARLNAMPFTRMCVKCQSIAEKGKKGIRRLENVSLFATQEKSTLEENIEEEP